MNNTKEIEVCSKYSIKKRNHNFQLSGRGDGEKKVVVRLYSSVNSNSDEEISNVITLDTTGPAISLTDGEYMFIPLGKTYSEPGYICEDDSGFSFTDKCEVTVEDKQVDMNFSGYQYIKYTATDFLGNETNVLRKIMVEVEKEEEGIDLYWYFAGLGLFALSGFVIIKVIKNKEKQKNQSVL